MAGFILYGMPASLYTGKPRAYLRKQGIAFVEHPMGSAHFRDVVAPKLGRFIVPVLETPEGELIQDGSAIIDFIEAQGLARLSAFPETPRQKIVALIFELFGGEGLLRPAMHYRWNFPAENEKFLRYEFGRHLAPGASLADMNAVFDFAARRMKQAAEVFGVTAETAATIEASYTEFLGLFDAHCMATPYLLGGRPSIGDYGLLTAMFAHLGRDPKPADVMRRTAPAATRWVERMNAPGLDMAEFIGITANWAENDAIPDTLLALLRYVATEYLAEIKGQVDFTNQYLAAEVPREGDVVGGKASKRSLGRTPISWRGHTLNVGVFPYRIWLLQRIQGAFASLDAADCQSVETLLSETGLTQLLQTKLSRRIERRNNQEVWGRT